MLNMIHKWMKVNGYTNQVCKIALKSVKRVAIEGKKENDWLSRASD
jgi:hypothetical protein